MGWRARLTCQDRSKRGPESGDVLRVAGRGQGALVFQSTVRVVSLEGTVSARRWREQAVRAGRSFASDPLHQS